MTKFALIFLLLPTVGWADQGKLIAVARDALVEKSIQQLKSYCKGMAIEQQADYVYLCHLQVEADCEKKKAQACEVLNKTKELQQQALVTEKSVESTSPAPIFSSREKPAEVTVKEEHLVYHVKYGSPEPSKTDDKVLHEQLQQLEAMKLKINPVKVRLDCESDAQCKMQDFGKKGCGGPMGVIVYSTRGTDLSKLKAVEEFTDLDQKIQKEWSAKLGWGSTCEYLGRTQPPVCRRSVCE